MSPEYSASTRPSGPALWSRLQDPRLLEFYALLARQQQAAGEDWEPMVAMIGYVRSLEDALRMFAFVSQRRLYLTTAARYVDCAGHHSVCVGWHPGARNYHLGYGSLDHALGAEAEVEIHAAEHALPEVLAPLLHRLLST